MGNSKSALSRRFISSSLGARAIRHESHCRSRRKSLENRGAARGVPGGRRRDPDPGIHEDGDPGGGARGGQIARIAGQGRRHGQRRRCRGGNWLVSTLHRGKKYRCGSAAKGVISFASQGRNTMKKTTFTLAAASVLALSVQAALAQDKPAPPPAWHQGKPPALAESKLAPVPG